MRLVARACGLALVGVALVACGGGSSPHPPSASATPQGQVVVQLRDANGGQTGTVTLTPATVSPPPASASPASTSAANVSPQGTSSAAAGRGIRVHVMISKLAPGNHGFDLRATGSCTGPDFSSGGPIFNPSRRRHGFDNRLGPEAGDLPSIVVGTDGRGTVDFSTDQLTLDPGQPDSIRGTQQGTSLVVHADADDERTQPSGDSGVGVACGVVDPGVPASASPSPSPTPSASASAAPTAAPATRPPSTPPPVVTAPPRPTVTATPLRPTP